MKRFSSYFAAVVAVLVAIVGVLPVSTAGAVGSSSGLSIIPKKNYVIKPGETVTDTLKIGNLDKDNDLSISLRMIDFTYTDQSGTPKLMIGENSPQTAWSLKPFTTLPKNVEVPAGSSKTVEYTIKIPANMGAGSYYGAIMYQAGGTNGGNVALNASGVTLAFVSVPGTVKENLALQKFGAYTSQDNGVTGGYTFIATQGTPKMIAYSVKNEGNVFEAPAGNVIIKNMFGHQVADVKTNPNQSLVLLGQTRVFATCIKTVQQHIEDQGGTSKDTSCVKPGLWPGRYTAALDIFYGQNGNLSKEITATATFWVLPWWFIITVLILLAAAAFGIYRLQRKIRAIIKGTTYKAGRGFSRRNSR